MSEMFHSYFTPLTIVPDHSLPVELPLATFSPNSLLMYEHESDRQAGGRVFPSSCGRGVDMVAFGDAPFDLNPVLEQSNDLLSLVEDDFGASSWSMEAMKVRRKCGPFKCSFPSSLACPVIWGRRCSLLLFVALSSFSPASVTSLLQLLPSFHLNL